MSGRLVIAIALAAAGVLIVLLFQVNVDGERQELRIPDSIEVEEVFPRLLRAASSDTYPEIVEAELRPIQEDEYWLDDDLNQEFLEGVELYFSHSYISVTGTTIVEPHGGLLSVKVLAYANSSISMMAFERASTSKRRDLSLIKVGDFYTFASEKNGVSTILVHGGKFIIMLVGRSDAARDAVARLTRMYPD